MIEIASFFTTFWGKFSIIMGGIFGVGVIAIIVNASVSYYRNKTLKKILEIEEKNCIFLKQIKEELKANNNKKLR